MMAKANSNMKKADSGTAGAMGCAPEPAPNKPAENKRDHPPINAEPGENASV